jgi:hypothetical protein
MPAMTRIVGMGVSFCAVIIPSMGLSVVALPQGSGGLTASRPPRLPRRLRPPLWGCRPHPLQVRPHLVRVILPEMIQQHGAIGSVGNPQPGRQLTPIKPAEVLSMSRALGAHGLLLLRSSLCVRRSDLIDHQSTGLAVP